MAVQEPGECQGQHSRYHWPPAITPEALSRVRLRSHIRRKRNGPTARYRYLSVDNVANLCCGTCTRAKYFHPHLDSQNFHGSRLLGSRVATIPFPINRNVHFSFLSFLFLLVSRAELPSKPCLFLSQGREKYKNLDIYFPRGNKAGSRSRVTTILRFSWKGNWFISRPKERISVCTSIEWRNRYFDSNVSAGIYFQPFRATGDEKDGRKTVTERFVRLWKCTGDARHSCLHAIAPLARVKISRGNLSRGYALRGAQNEEIEREREREESLVRWNSGARNLPLSIDSWKYARLQA